MSYHPKYCTIAYVISCLLDAVDGQAARALGQTSKFGAVLDMVTDRLVPLFEIEAISSIAYASVQMHNILLVMLPFFGLSKLRPAVPIPHYTGFQQPLHAYV
jgi:CDP-diacylglycerol--inositol 3-phosphatidyltransferase